ncbi:MAG: hypothetical protein MUC30_00230, partial [Bacteroidales bacterium]|nr:hypothetical protein [Bacteroidales bacterium]
MDLRSSSGGGSGGLKVWDGGRRTEDGKPETEDRGPKTEDRRRKSEEWRQITDGRIAHRTSQIANPSLP